MSDRGVDEAIDEFLKRAEAIVRSRPTFSSPIAEDKVPRVVKLAEGDAPIGVVGIPAIDALSGPHHYLELAKGFRDIRNLFAVAVPGFVGGEQLPINRQVAVEVQTMAIQRCMNNSPMVLAGISSGGTLAYGIANHLERLGAPVTAVVLIDAYSFETLRRDNRQTYALLKRMFEDRSLRRYLTETRLTAMVWYANLLMGWELSPINAPTLLIQPREAMPGMTTDGDWRATWPYPHDTVEVPGDHWTMIMEEASSTARAIEKWLLDVVGTQVKP
jgi:thioesterase domain-containing protein